MALSDLVIVVEAAIFPLQLLDIVIVRPAVHSVAVVYREILSFVSVACQLESVCCGLSDVIA